MSAKARDCIQGIAAIASAVGATYCGARGVWCVAGSDGHPIPKLVFGALLGAGGLFAGAIGGQVVVYTAPVTVPLLLWKFAIGPKS